jgi:hypothetical protein
MGLTLGQSYKFSRGETLMKGSPEACQSTMVLTVTLQRRATSDFLMISGSR